MAIGTALAIGLGSAVLGAGASAISASKNSKAINNATAAQTQSNDAAIAAQERARTQNLALQQPIYDAGMPAINARNALLGLGGQQQQATPQPNALAVQRGGPSVADYYGVGDGSIFTRDGTQPRGFQPITEQIGDYRGNGGGAGPGIMGRTYNIGGQQQTQAGPQQQANDAFDMFRNSTNYKFRLGEGMDAINSGWAGAGTLQSGAAMKSALEYGQNFASNEFGNYFGMLGEQQNLAAGSANAMSGVNTTYANNAGNLSIANGNALANAAVAKANNSNALIGSFASGIGGILGGIGG